MGEKPKGWRLKLAGILSSKGRRAVWERNNMPPPKPEPETPDSLHKPQPGPDGTVYCCGYTPMTPAAHALHLKGAHLATACGNVLVAGLDDPWISEQDARLKAARTVADDDALLRAEQITAYYAQRHKTVTRRVAGTSDWMAD